MSLSRAATFFWVDESGTTARAVLGGWLQESQAGSTPIPLQIDGSTVTEMQIDGSTVTAIQFNGVQLWP